MGLKLEGKKITYPVNIHLLKFNNRNISKRCETCSKLTIKTPERRHSLGIYFTTFSSVSTVDFKQVKVSWDEAW